MAYFLQWWNTYPSGKRLFYVCGEDRALVHEVFQKELAYRPINDLDYVTLDGKHASLAAIMAALEQFAKGSYRVIVLKNADAVKNWSRIIEWTESREMKSTTLICVGNDKNPDTKQARFRPFVKRGKFVECKPLAADKLVDYVVGQGKLTKEAAVTLVKKVGGDTAHVLNELKKFEYLPPPITEETVNTYVEPHASEILIEALFENNKELAMKIASSLDERSYSFIIGALEYTLSNLIILSFIKDKANSFRDMADRSSIPIFLVPKYIDWLKGVAPNVLYLRFKYLAHIDSLYRKGVTIGLLERLISLW